MPSGSNVKLTRLSDLSLPWACCAQVLALDSLRASLRGNGRKALLLEGHLGLFLRLLTILFCCVLVYDRAGVTLLSEVRRPLQRSC